MARCIREKERINGVRQGSANPEGVNQYNDKNGDGHNVLHQKTQSELANEMGIDVRQFRRIKQLLKLIPELQDLVESDDMKPTVAYKVNAYRHFVRFAPIAGKHSFPRNLDKPSSSFCPRLNVLVSSIEVIKKQKTIMDFHSNNFNGGI